MTEETEQSCTNDGNVADAKKTSSANTLQVPQDDVDNDSDDEKDSG